MMVTKNGIVGAVVGAVVGGAAGYYAGQKIFNKQNETIEGVDTDALPGYPSPNCVALSEDFAFDSDEETAE